MAQKKLQRFEAIKGFPNVLQYPEGMSGRWPNFFGNDRPITLELACGKGEYAVGLARLYPDRNFIGVDIKGNRIYAGAKKSLEEQLDNVAFLRTQIEHIDQYFAPGEIKEIWLTFPDPQLRRSRAKKRLTHPRFLRRYQRILEPGGVIHLKTDSPVLYRFTLLVIEMFGLDLLASVEDLYASNPSSELTIRTHYEGLDIARSKQVYYLSFALPTTPLPFLDADLQEKVKIYEDTAD